jgi:radical SAM protein with 4Fe4S-binding SPASM domain
MHEPRPEPTHLQVEVTNRCNLSCRICRHSAVTEMGDFPRASLVRLLRSFERPPLEVCLSGLGEPLLHPELESMIADCRDHRIARTIVYTNGTLLRPARADRLAAAGLHELRLSMDGSDAESLQRVRPGLRLEPLIGYMQHVTRAGRIDTALQFTATSDTIASLPGLPALAVRMGVRRLIVVDVVPFASLEARAVAPLATPDRRIPLMTMRTRDAVMDEFRARSLDAGLEVLELLDSARATCDAPFNSLYVTWRGEVTPCCRIHDAHHLGNVVEHGVARVWHGDEIRAWRARMQSPRPPLECRQLCQLGVAAQASDRVAS